MIRRSACGVLGQFRQRTRGDDFSQRRKFVAETRGEIDHPIADEGAISGRAVHQEGRDAVCDHESWLSVLGWTRSLRGMFQPGVMPLAWITTAAAGLVRKLMNARAASASLLEGLVRKLIKPRAPSASLVPEATAAVKTSSCCNGAGSGPASSTPGAINTLVRKIPSSASPPATACAI